MVIFIILLLMLIVLAIIIALVVSIGGAGFIIAFGDVIVCVFLIVWLMKRIIGRKGNKRRP